MLPMNQVIQHSAHRQGVTPSCNRDRAEKTGQHASRDMKALTNSRTPIPAVATYTEFKKEAIAGLSEATGVREVGFQVSQQ